MAFMLSLWNEGFVVVSGCLRRVEQSQNCSFLGKKCQVLQCQGYQVTHGGMEGMVGGTMKRTLMIEKSGKEATMTTTMLALVPSCPKRSCIPGFPSVPNPKVVYYGPNIVNLLPLRPQRGGEGGVDQ